MNPELTETVQALVEIRRITGKLKNQEAKTAIRAELDVVVKSLANQGWYGLE